MELPASLTSIGERAFAGCANLTGDIVFPETLKYVSSTAELHRCCAECSRAISERITFAAIIYDLFRMIDSCADNQNIAGPGNAYVKAS